jgi:hypothetical protein
MAGNASKTFKGKIEQAGSRVFVALPFNPNDAWGVKSRHYIAGTVGGHAFRGSLGADGGRYFLVLGAAWRRDTQLAPGTAVTVELHPEGPQEATLAPDVAAALASDPSAKAFFDGLATFYRKGFINGIEGAKKPETRARRIAEMMELLKAGKKQK